MARQEKRCPSTLLPVALNETYNVYLLGLSYDLRTESAFFAAIDISSEVSNHKTG